jgi:ABC-type sugar transport system ATPase subunit
VHVPSSVQGSAAPPLFELAGISKAFPNVQALDDVSLEVRSSEVLAVVGENGAGKSTLLRILGGDYAPDRGALLLNGKRVRFASPAQARLAGVRIISQEPEIVGGISVAENMYLGELPNRYGWVDNSSLVAIAQSDLEAHGFGDILDARSLGEALTPPQGQVVEVMRALKPGVRVVAFDEPTSSLTQNEVDILFGIIDRLRREGVAIVYVSHRISEILRLADRVAVLRDGRLVDVRPASELTEHDIVSMMVGRDLSDLFVRHPVASDTVALRVEGLHSRWHRNVNFEIRLGEVVGFAGLVGAGRSELAKIIFGDLPMDSGRIEIGGSGRMARNPQSAIRLGVGFAPEDRDREGVVLARSVRENVSLAILPRISRLLFVDRGRESTVVDRFVGRLRIRTPSLEEDVRKLSGGNRQKVVLARWLAARPAVLILDEPTRGIDVGAKAEIYTLIDELAGEGLAVMLISSELTEILGLSDRIYVMRAGEITGELHHDDATEERVIALAFGADIERKPEDPREVV